MDIEVGLKMGKVMAMFYSTLMYLRTSVRFLGKGPENLHRRCCMHVFKRVNLETENTYLSYKQ